MLNCLNQSMIWGPPLDLLVGTGVYLTMRLGLLQVLRLPQAFSAYFLSGWGHGDVSVCSSVAAALASTVGTGKYHRSCDGYQGWTRSSILNVDWRLFFGRWLPGMREDSWPSKMPPRTTMVQQREVPCYILLGMGRKWRHLLFVCSNGSIQFALLGRIGTASPRVNSCRIYQIQRLDFASHLDSRLVCLPWRLQSFGGLSLFLKVSTTVVPFMAIIYILGTLTVVFLISENPWLFQSLPQLLVPCCGRWICWCQRSGWLFKWCGAWCVLRNESGLGSAPIARLPAAKQMNQQSKV